MDIRRRCAKSISDCFSLFELKSNATVFAISHHPMDNAEDLFAMAAWIYFSDTCFRTDNQRS